MHKRDELPPWPVVRRALAQTTHRLAQEVAAPAAHAPAWNEFEWRIAMAVSVMHGVSGLLAGRLRWQGPAAWQAFLEEQLEQSRRREARARGLLRALDTEARLAGVPLLGLKGSALLALGLYAPGERPMSDVDLLVHPEHQDRADAVIRSTGYLLGIDSSRHRAYEPPGLGLARAFGEHESNPTKIELHVEIQERLPVRQVDITGELMPLRSAAGLQGYASAGALMRHLLLHTAGNVCNRCVRLIQLHDIAVLGAELDDADWQVALAPTTDGRPAWWAAPPLTLAVRLFPRQLDAQKIQRPLQTAQAACPAALRRSLPNRSLSADSLSHLDTPMLPGIEWSQSAPEALAFAWRRLRPPRDQRMTQRAVVQREAPLVASAWMHLPRWRKALSFVLGAPPRAQTVYHLHHALTYRPSSSA
ncbi:nucleotidyltransferase family protein [Roseateles puraquae]|uniref:nucleotidyltransferase family protein n=1 Tax=Roseateles puraquae TaxID=431059 RepID=UPI0031E31206